MKDFMALSTKYFVMTLLTYSMLIFIQPQTSQAQNRDTRSILIVGDSWTGFPCLFGSFRSGFAFKNKPYDNKMNSTFLSNDDDEYDDGFELTEEEKERLERDAEKHGLTQAYQNLLDNRAKSLGVDEGIFIDEPVENVSEAKSSLGPKRPPFQNRRRLRILGCYRTAKMGQTTPDWFKNKYFKRIRKYIENFPVTLKAIYLSTGGNDLMARWHVDMSVAEEHALIQEVYSNIHKLVLKIKALKPDIKIYISGYDFPNFRDSNLPLDFDEIFERMGKPDPDVLNAALIRYSQYMTQINELPNVVYQHHLGLNHYYFGLRGVFGKKETASPRNISYADPRSVGGAPQHPSDIRSMFRIFNFYKDPFHVRPKAYKYILKHAYQSYLYDWIWND